MQIGRLGWDGLLVMACCCLKISCAMNSGNALRSLRKTPHIVPGDGSLLR